MRKVQLLIPLLLIMCVCDTNAAKPMATPPETAAKPDVETKNAEEFFRWFLAMKAKLPVRDQFETEAEYKKRLPPPFDSKKVVYFVLPDPCDIAGEKEFHAIHFSYDLDSQKLKVWSERFAHYLGIREIRGHPISVGIVWKDRRKYVGTNAYGAKIDVEEREAHQYYLNILNTGRCRQIEPHVYQGTELGKRFAVTVSLPPQEARLASKTARIVLGVTLLGYDHAYDALSDRSKPTIDKPSDTWWYIHSIDAHLVEVILMDRANGKILARHKMGE